MAYWGCLWLVSFLLLGEKFNKGMMEVPGQEVFPSGPGKYF